MNNIATMEPIKEQNIGIKAEILEEIVRRKEVYKKSPADMISAFNREVETEKEYNGRQLLELLQNADDEKSDEVRIELDTKANLLSIKNRGTGCSAFSSNGIRSLMISNLSTKTSKKFIGNKGLGFRSIINWSESISINSNNLRIEFSNEIVNGVFDELFLPGERNAIRKAQNLPDSIYPIPFLSIPKLTEEINQDWITSIDIRYKVGFLGDIKKQIDELKSEILLFLNSIKTLTVFVDGKCIKAIDKTDLSEKWNVYEHKGELPKELWDKESEEEFFDLKIALQDELCCDIREIFAYFPTKLAVDFPFIIHGTFELNSSRNEINDSEKNRFILRELVKLIIDTAKSLTKGNISYKAIELLSYNNPNNILMELGFYDAIDDAINTLEVFPCVDGTYRKKSEVIFIDALSSFVCSINQEFVFENLLIPLDGTADLSSLNLNGSVDTEKLRVLSKNINSIEDRASMIYMFYHTFKPDEKLELLIDSSGALISLEDEVYTPSSIDISVPDYVSIKFIHRDLFELLIKKFEIDSNEKARELQRALRQITNIQQYQPIPVLQKIVSNANRLIKEDNNKVEEILTSMVRSLYENFNKLNSPQQIPDSKIQLYNKEHTLTDASDLYLSKDYPSGTLNEFLFEGIFRDNVFLCAPSKYRLGEEDPDNLEQFFLWLGVNKNSKFNEVKGRRNLEYEKFVFQCVPRPSGYRFGSFHYKEIDNFELIAQNISLEKLVIWFIQDKDIYNQLDDSANTDKFSFNKDREYHGSYSHNISRKPSFIKYQVKSLGLFRDFFFANEKLSPLVNSISFNFDYEQFNYFGISRSDVESLLLKIGATDKFEKLSLEAVQRIISELPVKSPDGRQTQAIYKLAVRHFEVNKQPLDNQETKLFALKGETRSYQSADKVFYNGNIKLPKKIAASVPVLNYPRRQNTQNIIEFFGVQNLNELDVEITSTSSLPSLSSSFSSFLEEIAPYILVYRIQDIEKDQSAKAELAKLRRYRVVLCDDVKYQINGESFELENNDYIKQDNDFFIKVRPESTVGDLRHDFDFQETFADIIGLIFDIQDTRVFRDVVKEEASYLEKTIKNDIGEEELIRTRELLGISDELYSFWKTVYSLLGKTYRFESDDNLLESVSAELELQIDVKRIDFKELDGLESCSAIEELFAEKGINVADFNCSEFAYYKIDLSKYHVSKLKQAFERALYLFKKKLYQWCIVNSRESQFTHYISQYESNDNFIILSARQNKQSFEMNYEEYVNNYISDVLGQESIEEAQIDFEAVYDKHAELIDIDRVEGDQELMSLMFFSHKWDEVKTRINEKFEPENVTKKPHGVEGSVRQTKRIKSASLSKPRNIKSNQSKSKKPFKHSKSLSDNNRINGKRSEEDVYNSLVKQFGKQKVTWVSKTSDGDGYDIKYINELDVTKYVEVKTYSGDRFHLSRNELEFARKNIGNYEIFLVSNEILRIEHIDFDDKERFHLESREYVVSFTIE
ncbi:DUF3883 domain-containing protein [Pseudoalteromonas sp. Ps84H-4]|uniref:DUF3883 domain-containing protein n=1 Tax=Pseudoalteromonas sp. Ps84H-4 TaxID=2954502 RepID=UPI002096F9BF|nr:DUF3883 domain-containing protein [Pseudoalteromonas sp. Ps84H-4]MCO7250102.1 DUF3883 domain-containing protein [Pseudoalteromonas sp. Ps84H-4]